MSVSYLFCVFFFKQKTAYEMRISDWSSDVCSSDLRPDLAPAVAFGAVAHRAVHLAQRLAARRGHARLFLPADDADLADSIGDVGRLEDAVPPEGGPQPCTRRLVFGVPGAVSERLVVRSRTRRGLARIVSISVNPG